MISAFDSVAFSYTTSQGGTHEVVSLYRLLLRRRFSCEFRSALYERRVGPFVSESIRFAAGPRALSGVGQCAVGPFQFAGRIPIGMPRWKFQSSQDARRRDCWNRRAAHGADAGSGGLPGLRRPIGIARQVSSRTATRVRPIMELA